MLLPGTVHGGHARTPAGEAPLVGPANAPSPRPVTVLVRPEQLQLAPAGSNGGGRITAKVLRHDFHGHDTLTVVRLPDGTELLSRRLNDGTAAAPGTPVTVNICGAVRAWDRGDAATG
jgi:iron(III) transport system ATP-binding protein